MLLIVLIAQMDLNVITKMQTVCDTTA